MSAITRPLKTGGNATYMEEINNDQNFHIKAVEVDADFDVIYEDYKNNVNNDNIAPNANIATSKIAQDQGLQTNHYADNSVTSAKILDGTITSADLAPDAIGTTNIIDNSITTNKIVDGAVTTVKIDPGATVVSIAANYATSGAGFGTIVAETTVYESDPITVRAIPAKVLVMASVTGDIGDNSAWGAEVMFRLKRDQGGVTTIRDLSPNPIFCGGTERLPCSWTTHLIDALHGATAMTYLITAEVNVLSGTPSFIPRDCSITLAELA